MVMRVSRTCRRLNWFMRTLHRNLTTNDFRLVLLKLIKKMISFRVVWPIPLPYLEAEGRASKHTEIHPPRVVRFSRGNPQDSGFHEVLALQRQHVFSLHEVLVSCRDGSIFASLNQKNDLFPIDRCLPIHPVDLAHSVAPKLKKNTRRLSGNWLLISSRSLSHWLFEDLPRFVNTYEYLQSRGVEFGILIDKRAPKFAMELANRLAEKHGHEISRHDIVVIEHLWFMPVSSFDIVPDREDIRKIVIFFKELFTPTVTRPSARLYISRRFDFRSLNSEDRVEDLFKEFGFEILNLQDMDWKLVMEKFMSATMVVGPHGAGLSNIIFAPRQTVLIEIYDARLKYNPFMVNLAEITGRPFQRLEYRDVDELKAILKSLT